MLAAVGSARRPIQAAEEGHGQLRDDDAGGHERRCRAGIAAGKHFTEAGEPGSVGEMEDVRGCWENGAGARTMPSESATAARVPRMALGNGL